MTKAAPLEVALDSAATLWISACTFYALWLCPPLAGGARPIAIALGGAAVAYMLSSRILEGLRPRTPELPRFAVAEIPSHRPSAAEPVELLLTGDMMVLKTELLLTAGQMLHPAKGAAEDELLLDDVLARVGPGSRVVSLFDPAAIPTAGELKARIDRHLGGVRPGPPPPVHDDSQALYDALAELRRSLG